MMNQLRNLSRADHRGRSPWTGLLAALFALAFALNASAQAPAPAGGASPPMDEAQMDYLVGPIALYPDDLVAIILPASTSPLQIVQAERFLEKRKSDPKLPIDDKWDDPVKSLLNYPEVVKKMSDDLDWTSALGEAVVTDQGAVLEGIQSFRRRAQAAGNLKSDAKQVVQTEKEVIYIQPADPQVIYVPQYTPSTVVTYGVAPVYGYYPAPYPSYYYPYAPGAALAAGVIWGAAIGAAWSGNRYGWGGDNTININRNTNINTSNRNTVANRGGVGTQGGSAWKSNKQPGQVSSSVGKAAPSSRPGSAGGAGGAGRPGGASGAGGLGGAGAGGGARPSAQPSGGAIGGGSANRGGASGGSAFANSGASGRQTQMDSSRGAQSRSSMSSAGARPSPSSAGARSGGGGARGGGGGGRGGGGRR